MNANLKTMKWLIKREFWENKGLLFYMPAIVCFVITFIFVYLMVDHNPIDNFSNAVQSKAGDAASVKYCIKETKWFVNEIFLRQMYYLFFLGGFIITYYLLGALHTERVDRSILFWKSLPISDLKTVISKILFSILIVPVYLLVISCICFYFGLFLFCIFSEYKDVNLFSNLLLDPLIYILPFKVLLLLPMYILWSLPTIGWILMVSSWAKSRVFPWAIGVPLLATLLLIFINLSFKLNWNMVWFVKNIIARIIAGGIPGTWLFEEKILEKSNQIFTIDIPMNQAVELINSPNLWLGVVAGIVMLYLAIRIRGLQNEI